MQSRVPVTLFPFLSVLVAAMGVLSFLAVTFLMFVRSESAPVEAAKPVDVQWVGAPAHVRPLLVECKGDTLVVHARGGEAERRFSAKELEREVKIVKELERRSMRQLGASPDSYRFWVQMKNAIQSEGRLARSFTTEVHELELRNLSGEGRRRFVQYYPILLIYPEGFRIYELASYLVETTTRLAVGLEPMLDGWSLPYTEHAS